MKRRAAGVSGRRKSKRMPSKRRIKNDLSEIGGLIIGQALASQVDNIVGMQSPLVKGIVKVAAGIYVAPMLGRGSMVKNIGMGIALQGGKDVVNSVVPGAISGAFRGMDLLNASTAVSQVSGVAGMSQDSIYLD